ncbi:MAG: phospholipid/cholesterol/gamma-HCH transport system substrate-binding protein, partial [Solirubrobacteraceae bacterium]|nr:phospholipid/cholesterol/gamma-HCH transport system substrate-binding protein [Solirubrobacteraceae bacterium]
MQKQAPSLARILTMVLFALSCFGLLLFLWLSFGGPIPLKPKGYEVKVAFPEATQLGLEADVRVAGVSIGKVRAKDIDARHPNRTIATIEVDRRYAPIARDARAILRQKTLLGETYVELTPGHAKRAGTVPDGGMLADSRVADTVQLDEIFQALDPKTRASFRVWQQELATAVDGRGADLNDAIGNLPAFVDDGSDLLSVLDAQSQAVRGFVSGTGQVFNALTRDQGRLRDLIVNAGQTFDATSRQQEALAQTIRIFPTFLDESRLTFQRMESFSKDTDPLVQQLRPAVRDLPPTLRDVKALSPDLRNLFVDLDPLITASRTGMPALHDTLTAAKPLLGQVQPFLEQLNPILQWLEYHQLTTADFLSNGAAALADTTATVTDQEMGHYLRQFGPIGAETMGMYATRPAASRGNAYLIPNALAGSQRARNMMFPNHDCTNAGGERMTSVPDTSDTPSCFVQTPPSWPPGNTREYPHIDAAS